MVGLGHKRHSTASNHSSVDELRPDGASGGAEDEITVVEPEQGNVLSHIISQLRPGADLSRVVLPTFILEPRSMLERITNFMAHPETLLPMPKIDDPVERFVSVVKFYLSGWHIKPPGVKKPLNPILGETFTCFWEYPDHTRGYYISEQTSHHPPKSSYFYMAPEHHIRIDGTLKPRSKFLGNSAASLMEGIAILRFLNRGSTKRGERYVLTQPNMYARGILFGKMKYELGDHSFVRCPENNLTADIEFKTKGYFGGTYNAIGGVIKNDKTHEVLYELSGMWNGEMFIKDVLTGHKDLLFDASHAKHSPPIARPMGEQGDRESQKLWAKTVAAIIERNHETATDEKSAIEDMQRDEAARRAETGEEWQATLFRPVQGGPGGPDEGEEDLDWILNATIDGETPEEQSLQILSIVPIMPAELQAKALSEKQGQSPQPEARISHGETDSEKTQVPVTNTETPCAPPSQGYPDIRGSTPIGSKAPPENIGPSPVHNSQAPPGSSLADVQNANILSGGDDGNQRINRAPPTAALPKQPKQQRQDLTLPIRRLDSETSKVDEFVDALEGP